MLLVKCFACRGSTINRKLCAHELVCIRSSATANCRGDVNHGEGNDMNAVRDELQYIDDNESEREDIVPGDSLPFES